MLIEIIDKNESAYAYDICLRQYPTVCMQGRVQNIKQFESEVKQFKITNVGKCDLLKGQEL